MTEELELVCAGAFSYHADKIPASVDDIARIIAEHSVSPEGYSSEDVVGVYELKDGRFLYVTGGCDTTGWDCRSGASGEIRNTLEEIQRECLTAEERKDLNLQLPEERESK